MCGIAGYSLSPESSVKRTLAAQALLAGIAERGADAVGYAHRGLSASVAVHKRRSGASELLGELHVPASTTRVLVHVRDYTKGHPTIEANNHPIRHGSVVGIHNGIIVNDEEIFAHYGFGRAHPDMTVDSEAIFALAEHAEGRPEALEELRCDGTAWLDERNASTVFIARGAGRPLWIGTSGKEFFASTGLPSSCVERPRAGSASASSRRGRCSEVEDGASSAHDHFSADRSYVEETILPSVRAPHEGGSASSASPRSPSRPASALAEHPSGATSTPSSAEPLADEELERRPGAALGVEHAVDLPFGQERRFAPARVRPVGELRQAAELPRRAPRPAPPRARAAPPPPGRRSRLAQRLRERAERVPEQRLRRHAPVPRVDVARGRRAPELLASARRRPSSSSRVANRRGTRPACRLAAFQLPKCSITVCGCTVVSLVGGELAHRRRAAEPLGARGQLRRGSPRPSSASECRPGTPQGLRDRCRPPQGGGADEPCNQCRSLARSCKRARTDVPRLSAGPPHVRALEPRRLRLAWAASRARSKCIERQDPLQRRYAARAELRGRCPAKLGERLVERPRRPIDARRQHRVEPSATWMIRAPRGISSPFKRSG